MTSSLRTNLTLRLLQKLKKSKALTANAFTLVELLVVVAIVGILSAIALPNFMTQTDKAKATEAKSTASAILKNAAAEHQQGGIKALNKLIGGDDNLPRVTDEDCSSLGAPPSYSDDNTVKTIFDYSCTSDTTDETVTVVATGNNNDSTLNTKTLSITLDLSSGTQQINRDATCPIFGGTKDEC